MFKIKVKIHHFLMVVCAFYSCQQHHRVAMNMMGIIQQRFTDGGCCDSSDYKPLIDDTSRPSCLVVLLHSAGQDLSETDELAQALRAAPFGNTIEVIQLNRKKPAQCLRYQIDKVYQEIILIMCSKYGKSLFESIEPISVHIFGFDEKAQLVGGGVAKASGKHWWFRPESWQFPLNIKTLSGIGINNVGLTKWGSRFLLKNQLRKFIWKQKYGLKKRKICIKSFEHEDLIQDYINFIGAQLPCNRSDASDCSFLAG